MYLTVELTAGTDIADAAKEMIALAKKLDVLIKANFNGIHIHAASYGSVQLLVDNYHKALSDKSQLGKMAFSN